MTTRSPAPHTGLRYGELIERRAARQPDEVAFINDDDRKITYGELTERIHAAAYRLQAHGISAGDRVACLAPNSPDIYVAMFAAMRLGAIFAPLAVASPAAEVNYLLRDLGAALVLTAPETAATAREANPDIPIDDLHNLVATTEAVHHVDAIEVSGEQPALIVYTSWTSGKPKGVVLTHQALFHNLVNTLLGLDIAGNDVTLINTPMSHIAALNTLGIATLAKGGTVVVHQRFDAARTLQTIHDHGVTTFFAVPSMLVLMGQQLDFEHADLSNVRFVLGGGAPMPPEVVARWARRDIPVLASYGMTEAGPSLSFRHRLDAGTKSTSSGTPALLTDIRIVNADGHDLPNQQVGEILVRGAHTSTEYWRNEQATAETFSNGWLSTGDRGYLDSDGDLVITGRSKEMIITGGENVDPAEVEHLIAEFPGVQDVAVVGRPDPVWGEVITAVVVTDSDIQLADLQDFLRSRVAKYKIPRQLETLDELPRSPVGKLLRRELQKPIQHTS